jgi:osmotically-inducible protein OsmY
LRRQLSGFGFCRGGHCPTAGKALLSQHADTAQPVASASTRRCNAREPNTISGDQEASMIKTDSQLQRDVIDELRWDPRVGSAEIGVAAKNGVVTLTGQLDTYAKKYAAVRAAERVAGVRAIAEELTVVLLGSYQRTDTDLAHIVASTLKWDVVVPDDKVKARIEKGWVWLEGEVEWQYQSAAAERAVRNLSGVRGVTNLLQVTTHASVPDVKRRIEGALERHAELDAKQISVEATDGKVTLRGKVRSWSERMDAESAAWSAPGVTKVNDELMVQV